LKWKPGTAKAFHERKGIEVESDTETIEQRIDQYLMEILQHLRNMGLDQLEREVLMLEEEANTGKVSHESTRARIDARIARLVAALSEKPDERNSRDVK
jgi:DNA repair exonuclease SbcCD nuclease subunit